MVSSYSSLLYYLTAYPVELCALFFVVCFQGFWKAKSEDTLESFHTQEESESESFEYCSDDDGFDDDAFDLPSNAKLGGKLALQSLRPARTTSSQIFEDFGEEPTDVLSEDVFPRSQKRMLSSFKAERERKVVWETTGSTDSSLGTFMFNVGDQVCWTPEGQGQVVGTVSEQISDGTVPCYRVRTQEAALHTVEQSELEPWVRVLIREPTGEEQVVFFETFQQANANLLKSAPCSLLTT